MEDSELLQKYTEGQSEAAFTELVSRHVNLVYSTAFRVVGESHLAQDLAQSVFIQLARKARSIRKGNALPGWLYRATCTTAANAVRSEHRRRARETEAMNRAELHSNSSDAWAAVAPLLEDAMQKRVSRAVEHLRAFFAQRGVTVGASGLAVVICANAVQAAPIGLAVTISTAAALAGTTIATTATATATKAIAMTTLQKTLIAATLVVVGGAGIYEAYQASAVRTRLQTLQQAQTPLTGQIQQLTSELEDAKAKIEVLRGDNERLNRNPLELLRLRGEVGVLRKEKEQFRTALTDVEQKQQPELESEQNAEWAAEKAEPVPPLNEFVTAYHAYSTNKVLFMKHPTDITVFRGKRDSPSFSNKWFKTWTFAGGHNVTMMQPEGGFDAWEKQLQPDPGFSPWTKQWRPRPTGQ